MRRRILPLALLLLLGCSDMLLFRATRDYFPLVRGSVWKYLSDGDTMYVEVLGDSTVGGQAGIVVASDFVPGFWLKQPPVTEIRRYYDRSLSRGGQEYVMEQRYGLVYLLPLVEGNQWAEQYSDTIIVLGTDTVNYLHRLEARVAAIEDITTPAGSFDQCYRIDFTELIVEYDSTILSYTEWLAPDVGLVRRAEGTVELNLVHYRVGP